MDDEIKIFLAYIENSTNSFAEQASSPPVRELHKKVTEIKMNKDTQTRYTALLKDLDQRRAGGI